MCGGYHTLAKFSRFSQYPSRYYVLHIGLKCCLSHYNRRFYDLSLRPCFSVYFRVVIKLSVPYTEELADHNSMKFIEYSTSITSAIDEIFKASTRRNSRAVRELSFAGADYVKSQVAAIMWVSIQISKRVRTRAEESVI